jgi:uridine phosphorylase
MNLGTFKNTTMGIKISELPLQPNGNIYHLNLNPSEIADTIILVGDPGRVESISAKFDTIEFKRSNREINTHTGTKNGKRITVLSTGMGTDNIDIVVTELDALANIDFETRDVKKEHRSLNLVRLGTCGALQPDMEVNSFIASAFGIGIDGLMWFYNTPEVDNTLMTAAFTDHTQWPKNWPHPYIAEASEKLLNQVAFDMKKGITATAPGFYGPQGREVRLPVARPDMNDKFQTFNYNNHQITNLEMETSALYGLSKAMGHHALTICVAIANRATKEFSKDYHPAMDALVDTVLERLTK